MRSVILSLATRLWGCNPEFEKVGEPETNPSPDSGGEPAEDEQDVGDVDSYTDVQKDGGPPSGPDIGDSNHDEEKSEDVAPPPPPPPPDVPPRNQPPTFDTIISPRDHAFAILPNQANRYEFRFACTDPEGELAGGALRIWNGVRDIVTTNDSYPASTAVGNEVTIALTTGDIPSFTPLSWIPSKCEDSAGNGADMGNAEWANFEVIERGVVHYWSFEELKHGNGNSYFEDRSNNNKDGGIFGSAPFLAVPAGGVQGNAMECNGIDDYVQTLEPVPVGIANTWTISWWQYLNRTDGPQQIFTIGRESADPGNQNQRNWIEAIAGQAMGDPDYRRITINYMADDGRPVTFGTRGRVLSTGVWQHFAMVHGGTRHPDEDPCNLNLYINGDFTAFTDNFPCRPQARFDRFIGLCRPLDYLNVDDRYLRGRIDEFVIRDRAMSRQEILKEYERNAQE